MIEQSHFHEDHIMPDQPTPPVDPAARIAELEAKLARVTAERDMLKKFACAPSEEFSDWDVTEEEVQDAMHGPRGRPLIEIIQEHKRKLGEA
jgi:transposase-like protein